MLHSNRELFEQAILRTADATGIAASIIEKDYYVTEFLRRMTSYQPDMVFKGGTSLSKCYKLIQRFSEDIDLNVEDRPSEGQRKALKRNILAVVDDLGLSLSNAEEIRSRRDYNRYVINYPALQGATYLKQQLIVETVVSMRAFPNHPMDASSLIYDFLILSANTICNLFQSMCRQRSVPCWISCLHLQTTTSMDRSQSIRGTFMTYIS